MRAILTTRCGCTRTLDIPAPPQPTICLPLPHRSRYNFHGPDDRDDITQPQYGLREFELVRYVKGNIAEYEERGRQ